MPESVRKILIVGIGEAGATHLEVLGHLDGIEVIAAVDPVPSRARLLPRDVPLFPSVSDASNCQPDIVVIATPTPTHAQVCYEVLKYFPDADLLVEKPVADNIIDARNILSSQHEGAIEVAFHMVFAPEVQWAIDLVDLRKSEFGRPISAQSWSGDPNQSRLPEMEATLGNSWIDSGINSLSVIDRFARVVRRTSLRQIGDSSWSVFAGTFDCESSDTHLFQAEILTSWNVTGRSRSTRIQYSSGAEVVMDHNAVAGYLIEDGRATDVFGSDGRTPRRRSHYIALYRHWLVDKGEIASREVTLRLHRLLLDSDGLS